ncbi:transmembrane protein, putative [Medicago truncatula]|uniref:Transmembrane protein, putative n=1 Tax=Medicago truncatula TaxID=3880 RepID=A0A072UWA5_MEDTR|nr:transmembrane protein, putative [Medicago truncatula]
MDNSVEKSFKFPSLKEELSVAFSLFLGVLCLFAHVDKRTAISNTMRETTHKIKQSLRRFRVPQIQVCQSASESDFLHKICSDISPASVRHPSSDALHMSILHNRLILRFCMNKYSKDSVLEQKKEDLELIRA